MNFAIIGATGNVGRKTIDILEKSRIKIENLFLVASKKSAGKKLKFNKRDLTIEQLEKYDFSSTSIIFLPTLPVAPIIARFINYILFQF